MNTRHSINFMTSLVLCFYLFFKMFLSLNLSSFVQFWLFIGLIIDNLNNIVNNFDRFAFLEYPNRYPNWVAHLAVQRFHLTHYAVVCGVLISYMPIHSTSFRWELLLSASSTITLKYGATPKESRLLHFVFSYAKRLAKLLSRNILQNKSLFFVLELNDF